MKKHNYIVKRLLEVSTWRGIYLSLSSIVGILLMEVSPKTIGIICAIGAFLVGQVLIWTRDAEETETVIDDIFRAAALALKFTKTGVDLSDK